MLKKFGIPWKNKDENDFIVDRGKFGYGGISISFQNEFDDISSIGTNFDVVNYRVREVTEDLHDIAEIDENSHSLSIDAAVELLGAGRFQNIALIATGLCFMADSMEITLLAFLSFTLKKEWNLSSTQAASITSFVFVGELVGTLVLGRMGDRYGRRPIFLTAAVTICFAGIATAFANDYITLLILRFFVGFGVGGLTVPFDIFAEFLPLSLRGKYLLIINYFWTAGSALVTFFAYLTIGTGKHDSWRAFVVLCTLPCFLSAIMSYLYVPESPRWLLSQGRKEKAMRILKRVAAENDKPDTFNAYKALKVEDGIEYSSYRELLKPKWRRITLLLWGLWFGFGFTYNGIVIAITRVFESDSLDVEDSISFDFGAIGLSSLAESIGVFLAILTVDRIGRIKSQVYFYSLAGIAGSTMLWIPDGMDVDEFYQTTFALLARCFEVSANCITWITAAEVLKTEIRTTGHSAANAACRLGAVITSYIVESDLNLFYIGILMAIMHAFTVGCVAFLPETAGMALGTTLKVNPTGS